MSLDTEQVKGNMIKHVYYVEERDSLKYAYELMEQEQFRHLPVLEDKKLVGILSDRDILLSSTTDEKGTIEVPDVAVGEAMTRHPLTCRENTCISDVAAVMIERKIDCLPVIDARRKLVGMITSTDLLGLIRDYDGGMGNQMIPFEFKIHERKI
jgi:CBS domain-containing protein